VRLAQGPFFFRLDLDLQAVTPDPEGIALGLPQWAVLDRGLKLGVPEWAMLQIGREDYHVRLGIITHMIGFQDWDPWNNYFPTYSTNYNMVFGRTAGIEAGVVLGEGYELNVFGGNDLDYGGFDTGCTRDDTPYDCALGLVFGAGFTTVQTRWATWSGVAAYPNLNFYAANLAVELYPASYLSIVVDGSTGFIGLEDDAGDVFMNPYGTGQIMVNVLPAEVVQPAFRVEALYQKDGAMDALLGPAYVNPELSAGAAVNVRPLEGFRVSLEGKVSYLGGELLPGLFSMVTLIRPEPLPYEATYPEEAPEEPATARRTSPKGPLEARRRHVAWR
jgi:hypothetical protein